MRDVPIHELFAELKRTQAAVLALTAENARLAGLIRDAGEVIAAAGMSAWPCRCLSTAGKGDEHPRIPCKARLALNAAKEVKK